MDRCRLSKEQHSVQDKDEVLVNTVNTNRFFYKFQRVLTITTLALAPNLGLYADKIKVTVWDERQPEQARAYDNFLGNEIAIYLKSKPEFEVRSVGIDDPNQGISDALLADTDVLIWWGHTRHTEISVSTARKIVEQIKTGNLSYIPLHSAHWAEPFMQAMYDRTRVDAERRFADKFTKFEYIEPPGRMAPTYDSIVTPAYYAFRGHGGVTKVRVDLPNCVFPGYRPDGKPSKMTTLTPGHPIAENIPDTFTISQTEMYDEPFNVPEPDLVIFREDFQYGGWFRSGALWNIGKGKIFYFRPGHEDFPIFKEKYPLLIIENAVRWLATQLVEQIQ